MKRVLVPIAMALSLLGLWVPRAIAGTTTKPYAVDIAPHPIAAGSTQTFTATLSNETKTQQIGSANLTVPSGFSIVSVASPSPRERPRSWGAPSNSEASVCQPACRPRSRSSRSARAPLGDTHGR